MFSIHHARPTHLDEEHYNQSVFFSILNLLFKPPINLEEQVNQAIYGNLDGYSTSDMDRRDVTALGNVILWNSGLIYLLYIFQKTCSSPTPIRINLELFSELLILLDTFHNIYHTVSNDPYNVLTLLLRGNEGENTEDENTAQLQGSFLICALPGPCNLPFITSLVYELSGKGGKNRQKNANFLFQRPLERIYDEYQFSKNGDELDNSTHIKIQQAVQYISEHLIKVQEIIHDIG